MGTVVFIENLHYATFFDVDKDVEEISYRLEDFCEHLDRAIQKSLDHFDNLERLVISFILKGYKKSDIARACFVKVSYVSNVRDRFVKTLADKLSDELGRVVSESTIEMYLDEVKSYTLLQKRWWDQWMSYREKSEKEQNEKLEKKLLNEIKKAGGVE